MEVGFIIIPLLNTILLLPKILVIFDSKDEQMNYRGKKVPRAGGFLFFLSFVLAGCWQVIFFPQSGLQFFALLYLVTGLSLLGLADDFFGNNKSKGFRGHIGNFVKNKEISTGLIKALYGLIISLTAVAFNRVEPGEIILAGLIVALSSNSFNSLDLRPGRALKIFMFLSLFIILTTRDRNLTLLLFPFLATLLVYLPYELGEYVMLGDSGANALGGVIGYLLVIGFSVEVQVFFLLLLIIWQIFSDTFSLTKIIASNRLLNSFDNLGRRYKEAEK